MALLRSLLVALAAASVVASVAQAQTTISFRSRELSEGRNFIKSQIAVPEVTEAAGQIAYSYELDLPQGRGVTPKVELQYASGARFSEYGYGWELTLPTIERTQRFGVVDYTLDLFLYREGQTTQELVPTGVTTPLGATEYKERVERTFQRYLFYSASNQWRILTSNGIRYELGTSNASRRGSNPNFGPGGTAEWLVVRMIDTNNNYADYEYGPGATRAARIKTIRYTGNLSTGQLPLWTVQFNWSQHFEAKAQGVRSGFQRVWGADQLDNVVITVPRHSTVGNPAEVPLSSPETRTYQFTYSDINAGTDGIFYLMSAREVGLPAVTFTYSNPSPAAVNDTETFIDTTGQGYPGHLGFTAISSNGTSSTRSSLVDVTGDGLLDLIDTFSGDRDLWTVWVNQGGFMKRTFWDAPLDLTETAMPDRHALRVTTADNRVIQDFFDLDGDGYPDLVWFVPTPSGPLIKYCPGNGSGFGPCQPYGGGAPGTTSLRETDPTASADTTVTTLDLADMNGDGLPDILKLVGTQLQVYRNLGAPIGFEQTPLISIMPTCPVGILAAACLRASQNAVVPGGNRRQLADLRDVNGDGLVDFVVNDFSTNELKIAFGDGRAFRPFVSTGIFHAIGIGTQASGSGDYSSFADMIDVNGDGLLDFVEMNCATNVYAVWLNNGGAWDATARVHQATTATAGHVSPCGESERPMSVNGEDGVGVMARLVDINGDGNADFVSVPIDPQSPQSIRVGQGIYRAPRLLLQASSLSANHTFTVVWQAPTANVPMPVHVPVTVTRAITPLYAGQPTRGTMASTSFTFEGGSFDRKEREFAGFFTVTAVGPQWGTTTKTVYGTTLVQRGLVLGKRIWNNSAKGIEEDLVDFYTYVDLGNGRTFARLDMRQVGPPPTPVLPVPSATTTFENYDAFGHATRWTEFGRELVGGDEYVNERQYLTRVDEDFMLSVVAEERRQAGTTMTGTPALTRKYYDDHVSFGVPPTAGNVVKVQRSIDGTNFITTEFFYDSNGNVTQEIDETGFSTVYAYDPSYARFRVRETNSIGTVYRSFHGLSATQADECGPQFSGTSYRCSRTEVDAFGRQIATWVPTLSGTGYGMAQLTSVTYNDNVYPLSTTVIKRGNEHSLQYTDGFGNPIQQRLEDTPGVYRVYDASIDSDGRTFRVEQVYRENGAAYSHAPPSTEAWTYDHDAVHGSIERVTHPRDPGRTDPAATATRIVEADRTVTIDEDGRQIDYIQDAYRRVTAVARYDGIAHDDTQLTYDVHGKIASVRDPAGNTTSYARNLVGWITSIIPPGSTAFTYSYNARGQVSSTTDQRGVTVTYTYDPPGRLTGLTSTGGGPRMRKINATFAYYTSAIDSRQVGWLRSESSDGITQTYAYTPEQSIAAHRVSMGTSTGTVHFSYDIGGRLAKVAYPDGYIVGYEYNLSEQPTVVTGGSTHTVLASYLYDDNGQIGVVTNALGLNESNKYDARGRRISVVSTNASVTEGVLVDDSITLSNASDITSLTRRGLRPGRIARPTPDVFGVTNDAFHQITRVDQNGALAAQYAYDAAGRFTTFNETGSTASSVSNYIADRLTKRVTGTSEERFTYDPAGDVIADGQFIGGTARQRAHSWDALQRYAGTATLGGKTTQYYYTPSGRIARVVSPSELPSKSDDLYIGDWARLDMTRNTWTDQVNANGTLVMEITGSRFEMLHRTIQQSVAAVSDGLGNVVRQEEFAPFGARTSGSAVGRVEEHFQGLRSDELVIAGGRAYDPQVGSWLARDFIHRDPSKLLDDLRLVNGYAFDFSNPYHFRDENGLDPQDTDVFYVTPKESTEKKGEHEWKWSYALEEHKKEYEAALGKYLRDKGLIKKDAQVQFHRLEAIRDVSKLATKDFGSIVLLVHGLGDAPMIKAQTGSEAAGSKGDPIKADEFAKLIAGTDYKTITVLGCDTVSNKFAPNLAAELPAGGTVSGYKGNLLELRSHFEHSKTTPGLLQLKKIYGDVPVQSFKTGSTK